jgi:hypothetical protein
LDRAIIGDGWKKPGLSLEGHESVRQGTGPGE